MDLLILEKKPCQFRNKETVGEWDQSGRVLNPGGDAIYRLSQSVVGFLPRSKRFFSGYSGFPSHQKATFWQMQLAPEIGTKNLDLLPLKSYVTYFKQLRKKV